MELTKQQKVLYGAAVLVAFALSWVIALRVITKTTPHEQAACARVTRSVVPLSGHYSGVQQCDFLLEKVATETSQERGLSGRTGLANNHGMLFVFNAVGTKCMWMKDMSFSIDMLWLNKYRTVIKIAQHVTPESYPESFCMDNTAYVVELPDGAARTTGIQLGSHIAL